MISKFRSLFTLQRKIAMLGLLAALIPSLVLVTVVGLGLRSTYENMGKDLAEMAKADAKKAAHNVWLMVKNQDENSKARVRLELNVALNMMRRVGGWSFGEPVEWEAVDQFTRAKSQVTLPRLLLGGRWLGKTSQRTVLVPLVDEISNIIEADCTVFQRINEQGDMLRVATSIVDGEARAIGTYIPAINPDGKPNDVVAHLKRGETFIGRANVMGQWYMAGYEPLKDEDGRVFGALFVGTPLTMMDSLKESVQNVVVGESGRVYAMGSQGESKGKLWVASDQQQQFKSVLDLKDINGRFVVQDIIARVPSLRPGTQEIVEYQLPAEFVSVESSAVQGFIQSAVEWMMSDNVSTKPKDDGRYITALAYYPAWDWLILAQAKAVDYTKITNVVSNQFRQTFRIVIIWCVSIFAITLLVSMYIGRRIGQPIEEATLMANLIATGKIGNALRECRTLGLAARHDVTNGFVVNESGDEAIRLREATGQMALELHSLVSRVIDSVEELAQTSVQLAHTTGHQRDTSSLLSGSIKDVNAAVKQIRATSQHLLETIGELNTVSSQAAGLANTGKKSLTSMELTMRDVDKATLNVSARLAVISQKTDDINLVVTTIGKVAEQTNLLSVNAAIEAEKAGEYGMGFLVVAREIRRMADQTATATGEIEQIVRQVRSAVSAGVMEMDRFTAQVNRGVGDIRKLSGQLTQILDGVRQITLQFENLTHAIEGQKRDVNRIVDSMDSLSTASAAADESTEAIVAASARLSDATNRLQAEAGRFEVDLDQKTLDCAGGDGQANQHP